MKLLDLDFNYPDGLVATERSSPSRILLASHADSKGDSQHPHEISRSELLELFRPGDLWVVNETKVLKRRVFTESGLEILFIKPLNLDLTTWEVLCPSSRWKPGSKQRIPGETETVEFELIERGRPQHLFSSQALSDDFFEKHGELPLPPYIQKARGERHTRNEDSSNYQSLWAKTGGSLAAPTASFHFDDAFVEALKAKGVTVAKITLHVGLGTFLPVTVDDLKDHKMHSEVAEVPLETLSKIEETKKQGGRVIAVGTTVARTLESIPRGYFETDGICLRGSTDLLITPGHEWKMIDVLVTNFHQPKSTLLALVVAFSNLERVRAVYSWAIEQKFRLFSYGDMTVWFR